MVKLSDEGDGWTEYRRLVLAELERLNDSLVQLEINTRQMREEVVMLKVKCGLWGALGAAIPATIGVIIILFR